MKDSFIKGLKGLQEDFRGVRKGAVVAICYLEGFVIVSLVALLIVYGFSTSLTQKAMEQAIDIKNTVIEERDTYRTRSEAYRLRYESLQESFNDYKEAHPDKN